LRDVFGHSHFGDMANKDSQIDKVEEVAGDEAANQKLREGWLLLNTYVKRVRIPDSQPVLFQEKLVYCMGWPHGNDAKLVELKARKKV
jgi:hypothetical protein